MKFAIGQWVYWTGLQGNTYRGRLMWLEEGGQAVVSLPEVITSEGNVPNGLPHDFVETAKLREAE